MDGRADGFPMDQTIVLEHLTGPSQGTASWLYGSALDVHLTSDRILHVSVPDRDEPRDNIVANLRPVEDSYEVTALASQPVWVNGSRVTARKLANRDIIEFGESGPLSRFRVYAADRPVHQAVSEILADGLTYLRVSRQPVVSRLCRACGGLFSRLTYETTVLFRIGVIFAIVALGALVYQQNQLNILLQQQVEKDASRIEGFQSALARARKEALTPNDLQELRQDLASSLSSNEERLAVLELRSKANARVIAQSKQSVVFLQGAYGYRENSSGRMLRHIVNPDGKPLILPTGQPLLSLEGDGPVAERQFTGTGFAIGTEGAIITNRHVAMPWEDDANLKIMAGRGLEPVMIKSILYEPDQKTSVAIELVKASDDADLAILRRKNAAAEPIQGLSLADGSPAPGDEVILMGYPTGLKAMVAQSGKEFVEELQKSEETEFWNVAVRLAEKGYIAPLSSRGIVGKITPATIVYDAETTHGGSGGPVLDINGLVVAVNVAILPEYGGSNLGVPVAKVRALLEETNLR